MVENLNCLIFVHIPSFTVVLISLVLKDAIQQFERRFKMVDGILHLGFLEKAVYTAKLFVLYLPSHSNIHPCTVKTLNLRRYADIQSVDSDALDSDAVSELRSQSVDYIFRIETPTMPIWQ